MQVHHVLYPLKSRPALSPLEARKCIGWRMSEPMGPKVSGRRAMAWFAIRFIGTAFGLRRR